jgi:hypothetical protein
MWHNCVPVISVLLKRILAKDVPYCVITQILTVKECIYLMENLKMVPR